MNTGYTNRLIDETSPYLLQHAHNPVNWYPWGDEALQKARLEHKVILVSIGYSACHWCHVMERESFENPDTAALMNEHFINIKIDREERPDLDHIYMDAVQAMTGSGGWPLNVFLTPDKKPFYGGTYFPPLKAFNRASWTDVLLGIAQSWKEKRNEIEAQADNLTDHLAKSGNFSFNAGANGEQNDLFNMEQCEAIFNGIMKNADREWGGFGKAPKFPQTFSIQYLLQFYHYFRNESALQQALLSIDKMLEGGIYDHVGGGLARYSTDNEWLAPHFEKMLYDNALLILVLCDAFQVTGDVKYRIAIEKTIGFVQDELTDILGGFYAALDADSEGVEGKFYVWQKAEVEAILGDEAALFCSYFDITEQGNWEETNILRILKPAADFASQHALQADQFEQQIQRNLTQLKSIRSKRIPPALDDKIILGWNALMMKAIAKAGIVLGNENFTRCAMANYQFLAGNLSSTKQQLSLPFFHTWKNGVAKYPAFLDDYAYLVDAQLQLYEVGFDSTFLNAAFECCQYVIDHFSDEADVFFFFTHQEQKDVIVRKKEVYDGATPSANAVMAGNLLKLAVLFDRADWRERAEKMLQTLSNAVVKYPSSFGVWASLFLQQSTGLQEVSIIGNEWLSVAGNLQRQQFFPHKILMAAENGDEKFPMLREKTAKNGTEIFLCHNFTCQQPFYNLETFFKAAKII